MVKLFGIDIAKVVADSIKAAGNLRTGTLIVVTPGTRTGGSLTGGTNPTETTFTFQGFVEERQVRRKGQLSTETNSVITILGASVSAVPAVNDKATVDGVTYILIELVSRDPASAVYEFIGDS